MSEQGLPAGLEPLKHILNKVLVICLLLYPALHCAAVGHCCRLWHLQIDFNLQSRRPGPSSNHGRLPACRSALCWTSWGSPRQPQSGLSGCTPTSPRTRECWRGWGRCTPSERHALGGGKRGGLLSVLHQLTAHQARGPG